MSSAERLQQVKRQLAEVRQKGRALQRRNSRPSVRVRKGTWSTACALAVRTADGEPTAALAYLREKTGGDAAELAKWGGELQDWRATAPADEKARLCAAPVTAQERAAVTRAQRFLLEQGLEDWVHAQNVGKGLTPRSDVVLRQASALSETHGRGSGTRLKRKYDLQWLRRWRRRWRCKIAALQPREACSPDEMREKARF